MYTRHYNLKVLVINIIYMYSLNSSSNNYSNYLYFLANLHKKAIAIILYYLWLFKKLHLLKVILLTIYI